jgi:cellulose synthase/poly-beta-1,6-N-acetylglucosamine synthase-like glycosyltransferase
MNDAFEYYDHQYVVTSFRNSKNFGSNIMSGLYGMYFALGCVCEFRGRNVCGCSKRIEGCDYVISSKVVENGWPYVTLTEDWEFSADQILDSNKIRYCDEAIFYNEQPTTFKVMWRQRVRWSRGHLLVLYYRVKD